MKAAETALNLKEIPYRPQKSFQKEKKKILHQQRQMPQFSQTSSECLKVTIQTYRMENKELKMQLGQLQEEISKAFAS